MVSTQPSTHGSVNNSGFAVEQRKIADLMNRLRAIGADTAVDIPVIAIVGSQSAGKSSIVNAISGITFPRSSGTCTRCPMECQMARDDSGAAWSCQIKLRFKTSSTTSAEITTREVLFGPVHGDPSRVEAALRRAQLAVLNPDVDFKKFIALDLIAFDRANAENKGKVYPSQLSFTENTVCLDIKGPHVLNLTFVDLPGMIQTAREGEDENSPEIIKALVEKYIKTPSTIILVAVSMETEFENQLAPKLARQHDPEGLRTIGVLTKPDIVRESTYKAFVPIIGGQKEKLMHGWFVTKSPDVDSGMSAPTSQVALKQEKDFFDNVSSHPLWKTLNPVWRNKLGIPNLTIQLSKVLTAANQRSLPFIKDTISKHLRETRTALSDYQEKSTEEPTRVVARLLQQLVMQIEQKLTGSAVHGADGFMQQFNGYAAAFVESIRQVAPPFRPWQRSDYFSLAEDGRTIFDKEKIHQAYIEPSFLIDRHDLAPKYVLDDKHATLPFCSMTYDLDDIRDREVNARTRELPGNIPFDLAKTLITESLEPFESECVKLFEKVHDALMLHVSSLAESIFGYYQTGGFLALVQGVAGNTLDQVSGDCRSLLDIRLADEKLVYTTNHPTVSGLPRDEEAKLQALVAKLGVSLPIDELKALLYGSKTKDHTSQLEMMAEVRAYWQIAYARVADDIPLLILARLVDTFKSTIDNALLNEIKTTGADAQEICEALTREADDVIYQRQSLLDRKAKLEQAHRKKSCISDRYTKCSGSSRFFPFPLSQIQFCQFGMHKLLVLPVYLIIWVLLHVVYGLHRLLLHLFARSWLQDVTEPFQLTPETIRNDVSQLQKLPAHLAASFTPSQTILPFARLLERLTFGKWRYVERTSQRLQTLAEDACFLVDWASLIGCEDVTLFDAQGLLVDYAHLFIKIIANHPGVQVEITPQTLSTVDKGLVTFQACCHDRQITVYLVAPKAGKLQLRNIDIDISADVQGVAQINKVVQSWLSSPDLLLVLGGTHLRLQNFPPWQLSLTEIYHEPSLDLLGPARLTYHSFFKALDLFSRSESRLGR